MKKGDKYGAHRVIEPKGVLPQAAERIDNTMELYDDEILVERSSSRPAVTRPRSPRRCSGSSRAAASTRTR